MNGQGDLDMSGDIPSPSLLGRTEEQDGGMTKKRQMHTTQQIQELKKFFNDCPFPTAAQRVKLGQTLNMEPKKVEYWFRNRRSQVKNKKQNSKYTALVKENEKLGRQVKRLEQEKILAPCRNCDRPTRDETDNEVEKIGVENTRMEPMIDELHNNIVSNSISIPVSSSEPMPSSLIEISDPARNSPPEHDLSELKARNESTMLLGFATIAMNELINLAKEDSPSWKLDISSKKETLNYEEYKSLFRYGTKPPSYVMEASRESGVVYMNGFTLVETLMDTSNWCDVFAPIVSTASTHKVIATGSDGTRSGSLQLMEAEFQVISPLVPKRNVKCLRYCQEIRSGFWVVVDVTPHQHDLLPYGGANRLPSGLIIEDMGNCYSKVTWIEQAEYDKDHIHELYQLLIGSGLGLGAKRWFTTLQRHCESLLTLSTLDLAQVSSGVSERAAIEFLKLGKRMTYYYNSSITGCSVHKWDIVHVENNQTPNMRFLTRKNVNQAGVQIVLSATTSMWLPVNHQTLFEILSNRHFRHVWDIWTDDSTVKEIIHIELAKHQGNIISVLQIQKNGLLVLQEVWNDASGAMLVYTPVETSSMEEVLRGENSDALLLLPSGFSILPFGETETDHRGESINGGGCLLTIGFMFTSKPTEELTLDNIRNVDSFMARTIGKIKSALNVQT